MPFLCTRFFGEVEYQEDAVICLPQGLPPFVAQTRFLLLSDKHREPLIFIQSVDEPALCFIAMPAALASPGYTTDLGPEDLPALYGSTEAPRPADLTWLVILTVPDAGPVTANLLAPVVIDTKRRVGIQAVRADGKYSHAEPLAGQPLREAKCSS